MSMSTEKAKDWQSRDLSFFISKKSLARLKYLGRFLEASIQFCVSFFVLEVSIYQPGKYSPLQGKP